MDINITQFLADVKQEVLDVRKVYCSMSKQSYRDGVLEGLRLGCVIVKDALAAEDNMEEILKQLTTAVSRH